MQLQAGGDPSFTCRMGSHCIYTHPLTPLPVGGHVGRSHGFTAVNKAAINTGAHVPDPNPVLVSFGHTPRHGLAGSYASICNFLRTLHIVFLTIGTNLCSHQQSTRIPFSPHPQQHLLSFVLLMTSILTSVNIKESFYVIVLQNKSISHS